jgi:hypothetical protein
MEIDWEKISGRFSEVNETIFLFQVGRKAKNLQSALHWAASARRKVNVTIKYNTVLTVSHSDCAEAKSIKAAKKWQTTHCPDCSHSGRGKDLQSAPHWAASARRKEKVQHDHQVQHSVNSVRRRPCGGRVERGEERKVLKRGKEGQVGQQLTECIASGGLCKECKV